MDEFGVYGEPRGINLYAGIGKVLIDDQTPIDTLHDILCMQVEFQHKS